MTQTEALAEAREVIEALVYLYVSNRGTNHEFISCITPKSASEMTYAERRRSKTWRAWDDAQELLEKFDECSPKSA